MLTTGRIAAGAFLASCLFACSAESAPRWASWIPFQTKKTEANPNGNYNLTKQNGPWMILATSFNGPNAEHQARSLVLELRQRFNMEAYMHSKAYDYTQSVGGLGVDPRGNQKRMRYFRPTKIQEYAVLVGNFPSIDDPNLNKTRDAIKYAQPQSLRPKGEDDTTSQSFGELREFQRKLASYRGKRAKGPMGNAFVTRNPMLPKEFFSPGGIDPVVLRMNEDVEFSLLKNPLKYTLRVATFRGAVTMDQREFDKIGSSRFGKMSKLEEAAIKAHNLTIALRRQGVEAYEFHDLNESIVTVGGFESIGSQRADGRTEINPHVLRLIEAYGAERRQLPGQSGTGLVPRTLAGITFDVQPAPVHVPKQSIANVYARNNKLFR